VGPYFLHHTGTDTTEEVEVWTRSEELQSSGTAPADVS